jgi:DNA polymerase-3 subunit epsilon
MSSRHYNRVLVFDVETNGLFPYQKVGEAPPPLETLPYVLQLSFIVYDPSNKRVSQTSNHYIRVNDTVPISEEITALTGIDRKTIHEKGVPITHALKDFYEAYMQCDCIVAHNIAFDRRMILTEVARNSVPLETMGLISVKKMFDSDFQLRNRIDNFCTMRYSRGICKIERENKKGEKYYKNPRLVELYEFLFHSIPENLHDSMVDTYACLQCFAKMKLRQDLPNPFLAVTVSGASAV